MTKIKLSLSLLNFITVFVTSCGNSDTKQAESNISVKPKATEIKGDLSDYFEVVDREYKIPVSDNSFDQLITVELKRKDKDFPFNVDKINPFGTNGDEEHHVGFGLELLGDNGPLQVNNATDDGMSGPYSSEDVSSLFKLKKGETGFIRWTVSKTEGIKSFQISSALQKSDQSEISASSSSDEEISAEGSEDWDTMLNDYEEYVTQYVKLYKKAMKGDNSALTEYPAMMEKATNLQESMANAQSSNQLSVKQIARMSRIQTKMLEAMQP